MPTIAATECGISVEEIQDYTVELSLSEQQMRDLEVVKQLFKSAGEGSLETTSMISHQIELSGK